ncbi:MAG: hypothetical protein PVSMB10_13340 [Pseudarthrobacter sp.]
MQSVLDAVAKNIVIDSDLNLIQFAQQASTLTGCNISFTTLPITGFGWSPDGASINTVDVNEVQDTVKSLLSPAPAEASSSPAQAAPETTRPRPGARAAVIVLARSNVPWRPVLGDGVERDGEARRHQRLTDARQPGHRV